MDATGTFNRHRLLRWLRPLVVASPEGRADRIVIRHVSINDKQSDVATYGLADEMDEAEVIGLAQELDQAISADADGLGGVQRYIVSASKGVAQISRLPLRGSTVDLDRTGEPLESEPATLKGVVAQLMRHLEAQSRITVLSMGQVMGLMQRTMARQQETIERAEDARLEAVTLIESMMSQKHERHLAALETEERLKFSSGLKKKIVSLLALAGGKMLGPEALRASGESNGLGKALEGFFSTIDEKQFEELQKVLTPEQMMLIVDLIQAVRAPDEGARSGQAGPVAAEGGGTPGAAPSRSAGAAPQATGAPEAPGDVDYKGGTP